MKIVTCFQATCICYTHISWHYPPSNMHFQVCSCITPTPEALSSTRYFGHHSGVMISSSDPCSMGYYRYYDLLSSRLHDSPFLMTAVQTPDDPIFILGPRIPFTPYQTSSSGSLVLHSSDLHIFDRPLQLPYPRPHPFSHLILRLRICLFRRALKHGLQLLQFLFCGFPIVGGVDGLFLGFFGCDFEFVFCGCVSIGSCG